jgi:hypothetical protein
MIQGLISTMFWWQTPNTPSSTGSTTETRLTYRANQDRAVANTEARKPHISLCYVGSGSRTPVASSRRSRSSEVGITGLIRPYNTSVIGVLTTVKCQPVAGALRRVRARTLTKGIRRFAEA